MSQGDVARIYGVADGARERRRAVGGVDVFHRMIKIERRSDGPRNQLGIAIREKVKAQEKASLSLPSGKGKQGKRGGPSPAFWPNST